LNPEPFSIQVSEEALADLKERLRRTRLPDEVAGSAWGYGTSLPYMRELLDYWRTSFDWRAQERALNKFAHFKAVVGGLTLHFIHQLGTGPRPLPLLLLHGWPDTFYEFHKVISPLSDPAAGGGDPGDAFDVVVPSLPGYGFSEKPAEQGWDPTRMAEVLADLMTDVLGYHRFGVHGGDWGAVIGTRMAHVRKERMIGLHIHMMGSQPRLGADSAPFSPAEQEWLTRAQAARGLLREETGYQAIQGTRPQTIAYAINDSPCGQAAWIVEKYRAWSDCHGDLESRFSKDELLTNIMLYWLTETANSASRLYYETFHPSRPAFVGERVEVPTGVASYPGGMGTITEPREWVERAYNVQRYTRMDEGGHFPALEVPASLIADLRAFFRPLRGASG